MLYTGSMCINCVCMARMRSARCTAPVLAFICVGVLLGGQACASSVRINLSGGSSGAITLQSAADMEGPSSLAEMSWPAQGSNLGLSAGEALTKVLQQLSGLGGNKMYSQVSRSFDEAARSRSYNACPDVTLERKVSFICACTLMGNRRLCGHTVISCGGSETQRSSDRGRCCCAISTKR